MDKKQVLFYLIVVVLGMIITLLKTTQQSLTKKIYVTNTYLYIILGIMLASLVVVAMDEYNWFDIEHLNNISMIKIVVMSVLPIIIIFALAFIDKKQYVIRHILWLIFMITMGFLMYPMYKLSKITGILWKCVLTVIILVIGLTFVASLVPENYFDSWGAYLFTALFALVIFQLLDIFFSDTTTLVGHQKIYGIIIIILFSLYLLYDTKKLYQNGNKAVFQCNGITNQLTCADYPVESLGLFLDIINLFSGIVQSQQ